MSGPARELGEVGLALLAEGVAALLRLLGHVVEVSRVTGELLDACQPVGVRVEARLEQPQCQRALAEDLAAPVEGDLLQAVEGHDRVDQAHRQCLHGVVLVAQEPDLGRLLASHGAGEHPHPVAAVERPHPRARLAEAGVVGRDRQVADQVQDVPAADGVAGHHGDHRLGQPADLDLQVEHVEAADPVVADVAVVAADALVAAGAEGLGALTGEDDHADLGVVAGGLERAGELEQRPWPEGVAHLRTADRDLGDSLGGLVADVAVVTVPLPLHVRAPLEVDRVPPRLGMLRLSADVPGRLSTGLGPHRAGSAASLPVHVRAVGGGAAPPGRGGRDRAGVGGGPSRAAAGPGRASARAARRPRRAAPHAPGVPRRRGGAAGRGAGRGRRRGRGGDLGNDRQAEGGGADRWLACVGLHSVAGLAIVARAWHGGLPLEVHERFDVDAAAAAAAAGATLVSVVPTMLARLLDAGAGLERFRQVLLGGAPAPAGLVERAADLGASVVRTYGLTETFGGVVHDGHPLAGVELAIAGGGEITLRGPMLLRRYRRDPAATRKALRGGWLHTADLGRVRPDGRLEVLGRRDDLVITGGVSVHPAEVEAVLVRHPGVADVAVGSAPDPEWGQRLVAYVVPLDRLLPPTLADLRGFARERLAAAKAPRELVLVDGLPRTASGKLLRRRLPSVTPAGTWPAEASGDAVAEGR